MRAALVGALALLCAGSANAACPNPSTGCVSLQRVYATNFAALVQAGSSEFFAEPGFPGPNVQKPVTSANQAPTRCITVTSPNPPPPPDEHCPRWDPIRKRWILCQ